MTPRRVMRRLFLLQPGLVPDKKDLIDAWYKCSEVNSPRGAVATGEFHQHGELPLPSAFEAEIASPE